MKEDDVKKLSPNELREKINERIQHSLKGIANLFMLLTPAEFEMIMKAIQARLETVEPDALWPDSRLRAAKEIPAVTEGFKNIYLAIQKEIT